MAADSPKAVVVLGNGYVGLPLSLLLAKSGHKVLAVDTDERVVRGIRSGDLHIDEPGLRELREDPTVAANLRASIDVAPADVFVIAVPTPLRPRRKTADLGKVEAAMRSIVEHLAPGNLVILESTVPPRTCEDVIVPLLDESGLRVGTDVLLAHCPERVLPGSALVEILGNDRVIGGLNEASTAAAADLYASFVEGELVRTDAVTAELCKLMENTYRDVNIALANELSRVAEEFGIDINRAIEVANRHPRVNLLKPGIGVGGHCIPIDPWFIAEVAPESCRLIPTARQLNDIQPERIASLIRRCLRDVRDPRILLAGATYKPEVYDLRQSPALEIARLLDRDGYQVELWDPITAEYGDKPLVDAARGCDTLAVLVPHKIVLDEIAEQREVLRGTMRCDRVIDLSTSFVRTL